jgi:hypothetical protein
MELYKHIPITYWQAIQDHFRDLMPVDKTQIGFDSGSYENSWLASLLVPDLKKFTGNDYHLKTIMLFGQDPGSVQHEHIDGNKEKNPEDKAWALNIPITNCEQGEMFWHTGKFTLELSKNPAGFPYLEICWQEPKQLAGSAIIDQPTIVKIDVPHYLVNKSNKRRIMLSARFTPDIY